MGKSRKPGGKSTDQHKSGFMIRLPEEFRPVLMALQDKNQRPMTVELQRALIDYAKREGVPAPTAPVVNHRKK